MRVLSLRSFPLQESSSRFDSLFEHNTQLYRPDAGSPPNTKPRREKKSDFVVRCSPWCWRVCSSVHGYFDILRRVRGRRCPITRSSSATAAAAAEAAKAATATTRTPRPPPPLLRLTTQCQRQRENAALTVDQLRSHIRPSASLRRTAALTRERL